MRTGGARDQNAIPVISGRSAPSPEPREGFEDGNFENEDVPEGTDSENYMQVPSDQSDISE